MGSLMVDQVLAEWRVIHKLHFKLAVLQTTFQAGRIDHRGGVHHIRLIVKYERTCTGKPFCDLPALLRGCGECPPGKVTGQRLPPLLIHTIAVVIGARSAANRQDITPHLRNEDTAVRPKGNIESAGVNVLKSKAICHAITSPFPRVAFRCKAYSSCAIF